MSPVINIYNENSYVRLSDVTVCHFMKRTVLAVYGADW